MAKKHKKRHHPRIPVYHAKRKPKRKMPLNVKNYLICLHAGKGKQFCRRKYLNK